MANTQITAFNGLNNVSDALRLGLGWLASADNVVVTDTGALEKRNGYSLANPGVFASAFTTYDFGRMYVVEGGSIKTAEGVELVVLASGAPMYWAEINEQVFFNNGVDRGIICPDNLVLPWGWEPPAPVALAAVAGRMPAGTYQVRCTFTLADGRETGAGGVTEIALVDGQALQVSGIERRPGLSTNLYIAPANSTVFQYAASPVGASLLWDASPDALGADMNDTFKDSLPLGADVIQFWKGRAYAAQYFASEDQTVIWSSEPLGFHLFDLNAGFVMVPGRVTMLAPHERALVVGTDRRIYALDDKLTVLADYGVVPGQHWAKDDERILFWTERGLCAALPFSNLTEKTVSVAPGVSAGGAIVQIDGQKRYVVALQQGGTSFNSIL